MLVFMEQPLYSSLHTDPVFTCVGSFFDRILDKELIAINKKTEGDRNVSSILRSDLSQKVSHDDIRAELSNRYGLLCTREWKPYT